MIEVTGIRPVPEADRPIRALGRLRWIILAPERIATGLPIAMLGAAFLWADSPRFEWILAGLVVASVGLQRVALWLVRRAAGVEWRKSPTWSLPNTWRLDDYGISMGDGAFLTTIRWEAIIVVREERDRVLFQASPISAFILPIRFLDAGQGQLSQIRALVAKVTAEGRLGRGVD